MISRPLGCSPRQVSIGEVIAIVGDTIRELRTEDVRFSST